MMEVIKELTRPLPVPVKLQNPGHFQSTLKAAELSTDTVLDTHVALESVN